MASGEAATAAAAMQTVVLRVSIHCHGCKKKVRKVLRSVEGVQHVTVDAALHKVTVTGTVDADTLIKRLYKSGKQAVPWQPMAAVAKAPEAAPAPEAQPVGDGGKDAAVAAGAADKKLEQADGLEKKPGQEAGTPEKKPEAEQGTESKEEKQKDEAKPSGEEKDGGASAAAEPKAKGVDEPAKDAAPAAAEAKEATNDDIDEAKRSNRNSQPKDAGDAEPVAAVERSLSAPPPRYAYEDAAAYHHPYYQPQPVMSYHTAQPSASVSYYAPQPQRSYSMQLPEPAYSTQQPPQQMRQWSPSYLYMPYPQHAGPEPYYQDYYSPPGTHAPPPPQMQDSYRIFDDENPNSCSVM